MRRASNGLVSALTVCLAGCSPVIDIVNRSGPGIAALGCPTVPAPSNDNAEAEELRWNDATLKAALVDGRAAWKTPDSRGFACASCHQPEPFDFAVLGQSDSQFTQHALRFASVDVVTKTTRYVRALRRQYGLREVCRSDWRPFQPGGVALPDDAAFALQLRDRSLKIVTGEIQTLADAQTAADELNALDLQTLSLAVPLPAWSAVGDLNDWSTWAPPTDNASLFALHDAWLTERSEATLAALETYLLAQAAPVARFPAPKDLNPTWLQGISARKQAGSLRATDAFRNALRGNPTALGPAHAQAFARLNLTDPCANDACDLAALDQLPGDLATDHPPGAQMEPQIEALATPWYVLALVQDKTLLRSSSALSLPGSHTAAGWRMPGNVRGFHEPVLDAVRFVAQQRVIEPALRGETAFPLGINMRAPPNGVKSLLLDGGWFSLPRLTEVLSPDTLDWVGSARIRLNLLTMLLLLQDSALSPGAAVAARQQLSQTALLFEALVASLATTNGERLAQGKTAISASEMSSRKNQLDALLQNNGARIDAAPEVPVP